MFYNITVSLFENPGSPGNNCSWSSFTSSSRKTKQTKVLELGVNGGFNEPLVAASKEARSTRGKKVNLIQNNKTQVSSFKLG